MLQGPRLTKHGLTQTIGQIRSSVVSTQCEFAVVV